MEIAFEELNKKGGRQFHPKVVAALIHAIESRGEHYGDGYETDIVHEDAPEAGTGSAGIGDFATKEENSSAAHHNEKGGLAFQKGENAQVQAMETAPHSIPSMTRTTVSADTTEILRSAQNDGSIVQNDGQES